MKITAAMGMTMIAVSLGQAAQAGENDPTVVVYISDEHFAINAATYAKAQATQMFNEIGVQIKWRASGHSKLPSDAIVIEIVDYSSAAECPGALACAKPYEGIHIRVFYDRLRMTVPASLVPALLGHVMAHEITHILQGVSRHSESGVMKAHWNNVDFAQMKCKSLRFTPGDVYFIERGLAGRESRLAELQASAVETAGKAF